MKRTKKKAKPMIVFLLENKNEVMSFFFCCSVVEET